MPDAVTTSLTETGAFCALTAVGDFTGTRISSRFQANYNVACQQRANFVIEMWTMCEWNWIRREDTQKRR